MMEIELCAKEKRIITSLPKEKKDFFDKYFAKVSKRRWIAYLKHYDETYNINDVIVICEAFNWGRDF